MKNSIAVACGIMLCAGIAVVNANDYTERFQEGIDAYRATNFSTAQAAFARLIDEGAKDWRLCYMLGNSYYRMKRIPEALLWYERALRLRPGNALLRHNIRVIREEHFKGEGGDRYDPFGLFFRRLFFSLNENILAALFIACLWVLAGAGVLWIRSKKKEMWIVILGTAIVTIFVGIITFSRHGAAHVIEEAMVMKGAAVARSEPASDGPITTMIPVGTKVRILEHQGEWVLLRIPEQEGGAGWVRREFLETI